MCTLAAPVREGLVADRDQLLALAEVGAERHHLAPVVLDEPAEDDRGVEPARVGEHDFPLSCVTAVVAESPPSSWRMTAFWACSRFSAWSSTTLLGPVEHGVGDLLAAVRGQAVHDQRRGLAAKRSKVSLTW